MNRKEFLFALGSALFGAGGVLLIEGRWKIRSLLVGETALPQKEMPPEDEEEEYRAVWVSYLEWQKMNFSSQEGFQAEVTTLVENCRQLGCNTILAQVRPFGDALYPSRLFPWSHLCTGVQGKAPPFDPLEILTEECHRQGLRLEGWINPYRIRLNQKIPPQLAPEHPAILHPEWTVQVGEGLYWNPASPEAAAYVVEGVRELAEAYPLDGVHFDDYFYPTTDTGIDAAEFAASGATDLAAWRRQNVTGLVKAVHDTIKVVSPKMTFGVSPQGNIENDYNGQYSDVAAWLQAEGEDAVVDYLCPQIYWGYHYTLKNGSQRFAFENIVSEWLSLPHAKNVALYFGLGCFRIGQGDGGQNEDSAEQWQSGNAIARQIADLRERGAAGYALYRYGSLYDSTFLPLATEEREAIKQQNQIGF